MQAPHWQSRDSSPRIARDHRAATTFWAITTRLSAMARARVSSCQACRSPPPPGSGGRSRKCTSNTTSLAPASDSRSRSRACTQRGQRAGNSGRLTCVAGFAPTRKSSQRWKRSASRGREIESAERSFISTSTASPGGSIVPRSVKSHCRPNCCSRARISGIASSEAHKAPTAIPDPSVIQGAFMGARIMHDAPARRHPAPCVTALTERRLARAQHHSRIEQPTVGGRS